MLWSTVITMKMAPSQTPAWLLELPGTAISADNLEILLDTASFKSRLLEGIRSAKTRIYLAALYLQNDEAGREVLNALYEAKQANPELDVHVLVDFHRSRRGLIGKGPQVGNDQFYRDTAARYTHQIEIHGVPVKNREWMGVLHLKGFVIDDTVYYSGASINNVYLHQQEKYRYDRYHLIHSQPLADSMVNYIRDNLIASSAVISLLSPPLPTLKQMKSSVRQLRLRLVRARYQVDGQPGDGAMIFPLSGLGRTENLLNKTIERLLGEARERVFICTPYFNLPRPLMAAISKLMKRGIKVDLVVGDKTANDFYIPPGQPFSPVGALPYLYEQNLRRFAKRHRRAIDAGLLNLRLWLDEGHSYHLKGMQIDDDYYLLTGNNLNPRAWALDLENGLLIQDPKEELRDAFTREREAILTHTTRVNSYDALESLDSYPDPVKKLLKRLRRVRADLLLKRIL
ncbi:CDP-diacylglycerol--serine O-phosphatidyltransferase [Ferrimonas sp. YFM]|uniref:CDP-diacylglycerol--serine O-phosphatidyltransferase n=1 Tax=Ferrimonas sp. YFM TaxID=3028878 RepID=UPI0025724527|nr:CDP-diacylglycerol--serine O-phosphatidyltransferase [Ferrimonas sp. YFM]BDY04917.1 CDP-diacylglycerol--serine O-phosphatidyltransferase [Ferrimonas sp. YFM]